MPNSDRGGGIVGRLAPSPTGAQHLGNARTYLIAWLAARAAGGRVVLRIEDIDSPRVKPWAIRQAVIDLQWLGLDWDAGPRLAEDGREIIGDPAAYQQTARGDLYAAALDRLRAQGLLYPCDCTRKDIETAASAPHESATGIDGPIYAGRCAGWQSGAALPAEGTFCWRFRSRPGSWSFDDRVAGPQTCHPATQLGDFPVTRKTGQAAYQLAVVVDDLQAGINQVVRGDDLIPSTFRQLQLIEQLGGRPPTYAHVPLVRGTDGRRLAKRHGDTRLSWYREQGVAPEQILGWCGWTLGLLEKKQAIAPEDLMARFSWERLPRESTRIASNAPQQFAEFT